ncbi:hypothetical protein SBO82_10740 [Alcaligenes nematophilus]|uniref:hypothetical protein n=1 Tax=Alcaligenes nematophilus TaxID=2994643 RepID=UPI00245F060B|nr:hypothetical protein [Alcaligenes nematophilus]MDH4867442.1 hypothetical protein [Bacillus cereus]MDY7128751.1 hypothetical protein [Alcaligenes nematophilus]
MTTYKQETKEKSRIEIWTKAIKKLTTDRNSQRILNPNYIRRLWDYAFDECLLKIKPDENYIDSWTTFSNNLYSEKKPQNLKIAYFCGPEPENDLEIMIELGVQIENVWAIESNKEIYTTALSKIQKKHPTLKIFKGQISDLVKITSFKFDIIYLDFTAPLFSKESKPLLTINSIFESSSFSDLGVLVVNSALPEKTEENIEFLSAYFRNHAFLEHSIYSGKTEDSYFSEGAESYDYLSRSQVEHNNKDENVLTFENLVESNFESAYSAFSTHYPTIVAGYIQPMLRVGNNSALKRMFLTSDNYKIQSNIKKMINEKEHLPTDDSEFSESSPPSSGGEVFENHTEFPIWNFLLSLEKSKTKIGKYWYQQFTSQRGSISYLESIQLYDLLRNAKYSYKETLSEDLSKSIGEIISSLPDKNGGIFCDVPLPHLWVELALNHLGNAHHSNINSHWRARYKAKKREMFLDLFVFDNCRALYDWLPMLNLYGKDMATIERQIIVRACMDAITKQNHYSSFFSYFGANLIGEGTKRWSGLGKLEKRHNLNE